MVNFGSISIKSLQSRFEVDLTQHHRMGLPFDKLLALLQHPFVVSTGLIHHFLENRILLWFLCPLYRKTAVLLKIIYVNLDFYLPINDVDERSEHQEERVVGWNCHPSRHDHILQTICFLLKFHQLVHDFIQIFLCLHVIFCSQKINNIRNTAFGHICWIEIIVHQQCNSKCSLSAEVGVSRLVENYLVALSYQFFEELLATWPFLKSLQEAQHHLHVSLLEISNTVQHLTIRFFIWRHIEEVLDRCCFQNHLNHFWVQTYWGKIFVPVEYQPVELEPFNQFFSHLPACNLFVIFVLEYFHQGVLHLRVLEEHLR